MTSMSFATKYYSTSSAVDNDHGNSLDYLNALHKTGVNMYHSD